MKLNGLEPQKLAIGLEAKKQEGMLLGNNLQHDFNTWQLHDKLLYCNQERRDIASKEVSIKLHALILAFFFNDSFNC